MSPYSSSGFGQHCFIIGGGKTSRLHGHVESCFCLRHPDCGPAFSCLAPKLLACGPAREEPVDMTCIEGQTAVELRSEASQAINGLIVGERKGGARKMALHRRRYIVATHNVATTG